MISIAYICNTISSLKGNRKTYSVLSLGDPSLDHVTVTKANQVLDHFTRFDMPYENITVSDVRSEIEESETNVSPISEEEL